MVIALEPKPLKISKNPISKERVGHGINPTGDAYRYLTIEFVSRKCGYKSANAIISIPITRKFT